MADINELRRDLRQPEFSEGYAESFLDAWIATQIKVLREQGLMTQAQLATKVGTKQTVISRYENVNYSSWSITTLKKLARAFRVRLRVSFETYGSLVPEVENFNRAYLARTPRERDPGLLDNVEHFAGFDSHQESTAEAKPLSAVDTVLQSFRIPMKAAARMGAGSEISDGLGQRGASAVDLAFRHVTNQSKRLGSIASGCGPR